MTYVTMTELRKDLSELLDKVEAGEVFGITRYGKLVAYLVPITLYDDWR